VSAPLDRRPSLTSSGLGSVSNDADFVSPSSVGGRSHGDKPPSIPQWSHFKTKQSKATLQLIALDTPAFADARPNDGLGFTAVETRLADAAALKTVQEFVSLHEAELIAAGHTKSSAEGRPVPAHSRGELPCVSRCRESRVVEDTVAWTRRFNEAVLEVRPASCW
jgi:hypothetical protein